MSVGQQMAGFICISVNHNDGILVIVIAGIIF